MVREVQRWFVGGFVLNAGALVAFAMLGAVAQCAQAAVTTGQLALLQTLGNGFQLGYTASGTPIMGSTRSYVPAVIPGDAYVRDITPLTGARGAPISVTAQRLLPVASTVAGLVAAGSAGWAIGTAVNDIWLSAGVRNTGTNAVPVWVTVSGGETAATHTTGSGANGLTSWWRGTNATCTAQTGGLYGTWQQAQAQIVAVCTGPGVGRAFHSCTAYPDNRCFFDGGVFTMSPVAVADPLAWCVTPAGLATVRPTGGLCPTETLTPTTLTDVQNKLTAALKAPVNNPAPNVVQGLVNAPSAQPLTGEGATTLSGPASTSGGTTTTVQGGNTTVTTITNNYTYAGDTVTWNEVSSQTVNGTASGTTTTTAPQADQRTDCDKRPNSVGCVDLGQATTEQVPKATKTITMTAETVGLPDACPAPVTVYQGKAVSFQQACDVATSVRPLLIAMASFSAALMFLMAIRGQG